MLFTGLKDVLRTFDEHGWKGSFTRGLWEIGNGGYDCWFELKYKGLPVASCVAGELACNVPWVDEVEKQKLFGKILEVYDHLKVREEKPDLESVIKTCSEISKNGNRDKTKKRMTAIREGYGEFRLYSNKDLKGINLTYGGGVVKVDGVQYDLYKPLSMQDAIKLDEIPERKRNKCHKVNDYLPREDGWR